MTHEPQDAPTAATTDEADTGPSRRTVIRAAAVASGAVWAAPAVLTFDRAFAATGSTAPCQGGRAQSCCDGTNNPPACDGSDDFCNGGSLCLCVLTVEGRSICIDGFADRGECEATSDCPSGTVCVEACTRKICSPPCPDDAAARTATAQASPFRP